MNTHSLVSWACLKTNYLLNDKVMINLMYGFSVVQISSRVLIPESLLSEWRGRHTRPDSQYFCHRCNVACNSEDLSLLVIVL